MSFVSLVCELSLKTERLRPVFSFLSLNCFLSVVGRFVKHTGYGNAAGLLARRGLLMGGRGDNYYSSTDEDSDTEAYVEKEHL